MYVRLAVLALLLLAESATWAGGPSPGVRRRCLGQCGNGVACVNQAITISSGCDFPQDDFGDEICPCTDAACTVTASGVFTGELTVSINEDCPDGVAGAHVTMHLAGRTEAGVGFDATTATPLDFCDLDVASSCDNSLYRSPFFCSNNDDPTFVPDESTPDRLHETMLPPPGWLVLHPLPASMARTVRAAFGASGVPIIIRAEQCAADGGTPDPTDGLPVTRTYCIKGHLAQPPVPFADCDPGRQATCIASEPLPSEGDLIASTMGADPEGHFEGSCSGASGPEVLFDWVPERSGYAVFSTIGYETNFATAIYLLQGPCASQSPGAFTELACAANTSPFPECPTPGGTGFFPTVLEVPDVQAGTPYCVVVDASSQEAGNFDLHIRFCPEDMIDPERFENERCTVPPPGCTAGATNARVVGPAPAGAFTPVPCTSSCCRSSCGDGERDPGEECDDGNTVAGDGCFRCRRETGYQCPPGIEHACGEPACLSTQAFACCETADEECTQPDGTVCIDSNDLGASCCDDPQGRSCCRFPDFPADTIVCQDADGATCSANALSGVCHSDADQCSECHYAAERQCGLGRMLCVDDHKLSGSFSGRNVLLDDYLGQGEYSVTRPPTRLCLPAGEILPGELPEDAIDPRTALAWHTAKATQSPVDLPPRVRMADEVYPQGVVLELRGTNALLVPTATADAAAPGPPDPLSHGVDHYRCAKVSVVSGICIRHLGSDRTCNRDSDCITKGSCFGDSDRACDEHTDCGDGGFCVSGDNEGPCINRQAFSRRSSTISTLLGARAMTPTRLKRLCIATSVDGSILADDRLHLACYKAIEARDLCAADPTECDQTTRKQLFASNTFGTGQFETESGDELCFPARLDLYPAAD